MRKLKAGLLPLSMELLYKRRPEIKAGLEDFVHKISGCLKSDWISLITAPVCCVSNEINNAVSDFREKEADTIITLHLTYSPSLESANILSQTKTPIIILNTTPSFDFGPGKSPDEITYNHGIHGVQDFCNILARNNKRFFIESGHWEKSDVVERVKKRVCQAAMANRFSSSRTGIIGRPFDGMGDFQLPFETIIKKTGMQIIEGQVSDIIANFGQINEKEIEEEIDIDKNRFIIYSSIDNELLRESVKCGLALRKWITANKLVAFTMNALSFNYKSKLPIIPFLEASKQMAAGTGYAGEGDVLTANLLNAISYIYPQSAFTENFCPDWNTGSIFLNHIGEGNFNLLKDKPLLVSKKYAISDSRDVVVLSGTYKPGNAFLVDIAPGCNEGIGLIISKGEMLNIKTKDNLNNTIHGWFKPAICLEDFLSDYSKLGGTHHCVLVYAENSYEIEQFGFLSGWEINRIC